MNLPALARGLAAGFWSSLSREGWVVIDPKVIQQMVDRIVAAVDPEGIVLFGSQARQTATEESDVDLFIVHRGPHLRKMQREAYRALMGRQVAVDLLIRSPEDMAERLSWPDPFLRDIVREGRIVYEKRGGQGMAIFSKE